MATRAEVVRFLKGQRSIHLYKNLQIALADVLSAMSDKNYRYLTKNLIIIALHKTALGQAMFFPNPKGEIKLIEFHYRKELPLDSLSYVVAHELGHLMYGQLMPKKGYTWGNLEGWADERAKEWGFPKTKEIKRKLDRLR